MVNRIQTRFWGVVEYEDSEVIHFPSGIPAFDHCREFLPIRREATGPLVFLQSVAEPALCFVTVPVTEVCPDYRLSAFEEDLEQAGFPAGCRPETDGEFECLAILTLIEGQPPTANLLAPVLLNHRTRRGVQAVQVDTGYSTRHPLGARR